MYVASQLGIFILLVIFPTAVSGTLLVCSKTKDSQPKLYDNTTKQCKNGEVVPKQDITNLPLKSKSSDRSQRPTSPSQSPDTSTPTQSPDTSTLSQYHVTSNTPAPSCIDPTEVKDGPRMCNKGQKLCRGYECCGNNDVYHPDFDTCCTRMGKSRVHPNMPEKEHVCCKMTLKAYERGKQPCLHPETNDRLWKPKPKPISDMKNQHRCNNTFMYRVEQLNRNSMLGTDEAPSATIGIHLIFPKVKKELRKLIMTVPLDNYSPMARNQNKDLLILSRHDRRKESLFYVYADDEVYRISKRRKNKNIKRQVRRNHRMICTKRSRKHFRHWKSKFLRSLYRGG